MLQKHLKERVMLCPGCLSRYPRQSLEQLVVDCPRCAHTMQADLVSASDDKVLSPRQRAALTASSETFMGRPLIPSRPTARRGVKWSTGSKGQPVALAVIGVLVLFGGVALLVYPGTSRRPPLRGVNNPTLGEDKPDQPPKDPGPKAPSGPPSLPGLQQEEATLVARGELERALRLWRLARPGPGDDASQFRSFAQARVTELEALQGRAVKAKSLLEAVRQGSPTSERDLVRLLAETVRWNLPVFSEANLELQKQFQLRREEAEQTAKRRLQEVQGEGAGDPWPGRKKRAPRSMRLPLDGVPSEGLQVMELSAETFSLRIPGEAELRECRWGEDPLLDLRLFEGFADPASPRDQSDLLLRALLARDPIVAKRTLQGIATAQPLNLDVAELLESAPHSAPLVPFEGFWRLDYPVSWLPKDLLPAKGSTLEAGGGGLLLGGKPCALTTSELPLERSPRRTVSIFARLTGRERFYVALDLLGKGTQRSYTVRCEGKRWSLEFDLGRGPQRVAKGSSSRLAGRLVGLSYAKGVVEFSLDGLTLAQGHASSRFLRARGRVGAEAGPLSLSSLALHGSFKRDQAKEAAWAGKVRAKIADLELDLRARGAAEFQLLSREDPQDLARAPEASLELLQKAKAALLQGDARKARALIAEGPGLSLPAAAYFSAYASLLLDDLGTAHSILRDLCDREPQFLEAHALRSLTLALVGRGEDALDVLNRVEGNRLHDRSREVGRYDAPDLRGAVGRAREVDPPR